MIRWGVVGLCGLWAGAVLSAEAADTQPPAEPSVQAADPVDADWKRVVDRLLPVSPEEVRDFKRAKDALKEAAKPRETPASAESNAITVSMQPGAHSPRVTLLHGFVTALEILDNTGQPWPIESAMQGDPTAVAVRIEGATATESPTALIAVDADGASPPPPPTSTSRSAGNILTVNPLTPFTATNLILVLRGASRPVSVLLSPSEAQADSALQDRITLLVDGRGPLSRVDPVANYDHLDAGDDLRNVLVGRAPNDEAREILIELPAGVRAWRTDDELWVRTPDRIVSPAPAASVAMGDVRAYRMTYIPIVVVARGGRLEEVSVVKRSN